MREDLVTVIIPVYNKVEYLFDSLSSVVNQTYSNIEIIVVDDGSNNYDKILRICNNFKKKIKIIKFKRNKGVSAALNAAILASNGKYINWLSHDDLFSPTKIEEQIRSLAGAEDKISITNFILWNVAKNKKRKIFLEKKDFNDFTENLLLKDIYNFCTLLVPKKLYINNYFNEKLRHVQDYDMFLKLSNNVKFFFLDRHLFISRVHPHQDSVVKKNRWINEKNNFYINHIQFYLKILKNKKSFKNIFVFLFFLRLKKLQRFNLYLDSEISKMNNKKINSVNKIVKIIIKIINNFR
jgi:glycosyltransferase involved in cell wall biosynthesis